MPKTAELTFLNLVIYFNNLTLVSDAESIVSACRSSVNPLLFLFDTTKLFIDLFLYLNHSVSVYHNYAEVSLKGYAITLPLKEVSCYL